MASRAALGRPTDYKELKRLDYGHCRLSLAIPQEQVWDGPASLAGARIGYALAHPDTIKLFNSMQPWPNAGASATAVAAASTSLDDTGFFTMVVQKNQAEKNK